MLSVPTAPDFSSSRKFGITSKLAVDLNINPNTAHVLFLAPWGEACGYHGVSSSLIPTNSDNILYPAALTDTYVESFLAPYSQTVGSGDTRITSPPWRCTKFCVEMLCTSPISLVGGWVSFTRWMNGKLPYTNTSPAGPGLAEVYRYITRSDAGTYVVPVADLLHTRCFETAMCDRQALEFTAVAPEGSSTAASNWDRQYLVGDDSPTIASELGSGLPPWRPMVVWIANTTHANLLLRFVIRSSHEKQPNFSSWESLIGKVPRPLRPSDEVSWWNRQRAILVRPLTTVNTAQSTAMSRSYAGVAGRGPPLPVNTAQSSRTRPNRTNRRSTTTPTTTRPRQQQRVTTTRPSQRPMIQRAADAAMRAIRSNPGMARAIAKAVSSGTLAMAASRPRLAIKDEL